MSSWRSQRVKENSFGHFNLEHDMICFIILKGHRLSYGGKAYNMEKQDSVLDSVLIIFLNQKFTWEICKGVRFND